MTLYKKDGNKWDWATMKAQAAKVSGGKFYSDYSMTTKVWVMANGTRLVQEKTVDGGKKLQATISGNQPFINSQKFVQGLLGLGSQSDSLYVPKNVLKGDGGSDKKDNLWNGEVLAWCSESGRYESIVIGVKKSAAFEKNQKNLGVAPVPYGPDNKNFKNGYPAGWLTGFGAGRGSDVTAPKLVAAMTVYHSLQKPTGIQPTSEEQAVFNKLYANLNYVNFGYGTADGTMDKLLNEMETAIFKGGDITQLLKQNQDAATSYLRASLSQQ
jgi:hypothetical protein